MCLPKKNKAKEDNGNAPCVRTASAYKPPLGLWKMKIQRGKGRLFIFLLLGIRGRRMKQQCATSWLRASVFLAKHPHAPFVTRTEFALHCATSNMFTISSIYAFCISLALIKENHHISFKVATLSGNIYLALHTNSRRANLAKLVPLIQHLKYMYNVTNFGKYLEPNMKYKR